MATRTGTVYRLSVDGAEAIATFKGVGDESERAGQRVQNAFKAANDRLADFSRLGEQAQEALRQGQAGLDIQRRQDPNIALEERRLQILELQRTQSISLAQAVNELAAAEERANQARLRQIGEAVGPSVQAVNQQIAYEQRLKEERDRRLAQLDPLIRLEQEEARIHELAAAKLLDEAQKQQLLNAARDRAASTTTKLSAEEQRLNAAADQLNRQYQEGFALQERRREIHQLQARGKIDEAVATRALIAAERELAGASNLAGQRFGNLRAGFQQLPLQLQDIIVSMQGGTDAAVVFAQQGPQILSAFGPVGAVLGVVAGALAAAGGAALLFGQNSADAGERADEMRQQLEDLDQRLGIVRDSTDEFSASLNALSEAERDLSLANVIAQFDTAKAAADTAKTSVLDTLESISRATQQTQLPQFADVFSGAPAAPPRAVPPQVQRVEEARRVFEESLRRAQEQKLPNPFEALAPEITELQAAIKGLDPVIVEAFTNGQDEANKFLGTVNELQKRLEEMRRADIQRRQQEGAPVSETDLNFLDQERIRREAIKDLKEVDFEGDRRRLRARLDLMREQKRSEEDIRAAEIAGITEITRAEEQHARQQRVLEAAKRIGGPPETALRRARELDEAASRTFEPLDRRARLEQEITEWQERRRIGLTDEGRLNLEIAERRREIAEIDRRAAEARARAARRTPEAREARRLETEEARLRRRDVETLREFQEDLARTDAIARTEGGQIIRVTAEQTNAFQTASELRAAAIREEAGSVDQLIERQEFIDRYVDKLSRLATAEQRTAAERAGAAQFERRLLPEQAEGLAQLGIATDREVEEQQRLVATMGQGAAARRRVVAEIEAENQLRRLGIDIKSDEAIIFRNEIASANARIEALREGVQTQQDHATGAEYLRDRIADLAEQYRLGAIDIRTYTLELERANLEARRRQVEQGPAGRRDIEEEFERLRIEELRAGAEGPFGGFEAALRDYRLEAGTTAEAIEDAFRTAFDGMEDALVEFITTGKASFKEMTAEILADLSRIALHQAFAAILGAAITPAPRGPTPAGAGPTPLFPGLYHDGGTVGLDDAPHRQVPAWLFMDAPRMHDGNASAPAESVQARLHLRHDERPAILERGEVVVPRRLAARADEFAAYAPAPPPLLHGAVSPWLKSNEYPAILQEGEVVIARRVVEARIAERLGRRAELASERPRLRPSIVHDGGTVGSTAFKFREVPADLFTRAPRLHNGTTSRPLLEEDEERPTRRQRGGDTYNITVPVDARGSTDPARVAAVARVAGYQGAQQALAEADRNPRARQRLTR